MNSAAAPDAAPPGTDYADYGLSALLAAKRDDYSGYAVVSQDSPVCVSRAVDGLLDGSPVFEQSGPAGTTVTFPLHRFWRHQDG